MPQGTCRLMVAEPQHWSKACMALGKKLGRTFPLAQQVAQQLAHLAQQLPHLANRAPHAPANVECDDLGGDLVGVRDRYYEQQATRDEWEAEGEEQATDSSFSGTLSELDDSEWADEDQGPQQEDLTTENQMWTHSATSLKSLGDNLRELAGTVTQATQEAAALCKLLQNERELTRPNIQAAASSLVPEHYYKQ